MTKFYQGQRWMSESEPELGLGLITEVTSKIITCNFPAAKVERKYGTNSAPLKRVVFNIGDEIFDQSGNKFIVEAIKDEQGVLVYQSSNQIINESNLNDMIVLSKPQERLLTQSFDPLSFFNLRYETLLNLRKNLSSKHRGFVGPRVSLIPHQFYVAQSVVSQSLPRVLLADEVGLGKTIEAGLILHKLILTGRASKVLILVPDSLVYQWFVEMLRKFSLSFNTINHESQITAEDMVFESGQLFIASLKYMTKDTVLLDQMLETKWDMVVVDEAHQLRWTPEESSLEYDIIETLCGKLTGLLLLSGTPEILGLAGHFARLKLLDPHRFHDYPLFLEEMMSYQEISKLAQKLLEKSALSKAEKDFLKNKCNQIIDSEKDYEIALKKLLDQHGTGRIYFRNTRENIALYKEFFPKRHLHAYPLKLMKNNFETKLNWLVDYLSHADEGKILIICHDKEMVEKMEYSLKDKTLKKIAFFHSGMNLMNRDRQAAYFADPKGADVLIATEIGSEGRNFEFANHLVMLDLPRLPDLLEQRIGRLDRIGQKQNIHIHIPYLLTNEEEVWFRWYHEGLNAFEQSPKGGSEIFATLQQELLLLVNQAQEQSLDLSKMNLFLEQVNQLKVEVEEKLRLGQDKLVELNSFDYLESLQIIKQVKEFENISELKAYLFKLFEVIGVDVEELEDEIYFIKPSDNMYLPVFPSLSNEGMSVTFVREIALRREDIGFLSWDHPMVNGIIELLSSKEIGNCTLAQFTKEKSEQLWIEAFFLLSFVGDKRLQGETYFPPTPLRVLINSQFQDLTAKIPKKDLDPNLTFVSDEKKQSLEKIPKDFYIEALKRAKDFSLTKAKVFKDNFISKMETELNLEIERLSNLKKVNASVSDQEIDYLIKKKELLKAAMSKPSLTLDSIRVIVT